MASIVTNLTCELTAPVSVVFLPGNMFSMDNGGNIINVFVVQNGEPVALGGSVSANVIRSDGTTVAITGALEGNKAYIILPQACYAVPGIIHIVMKITEGTTITTIAAITANVYQSSTDAVVDPGTLVPSIAALIEAIEDAVDSIPVDYSGLLATLAADYSTSKTYKVGDYAWYGGVLKRCIVAITTAESYTAAHWTNAVLGDDVSALKSAINGITGNDIIPITQKGYYLALSSGSVDISDPTGSANFDYSLVPCSEGDVFTINSLGGSSPRAWIFIESDGTAISYAAGSADVNNLVLTAPADAAYLIINDKGKRQSYFGKVIVDRVADLEAAKTNNETLHPYPFSTYFDTQREASTNWWINDMGYHAGYVNHVKTYIWGDTDQTVEIALVRANSDAGYSSSNAKFKATGKYIICKLTATGHGYVTIPVNMFIPCGFWVAFKSTGGLAYYQTKNSPYHYKSTSTLFSGLEGESADWEWSPADLVTTLSYIIAAEVEYASEAELKVNQYPAVKTLNTMFCVGDSQTAGYPYQNTDSLAGIYWWNGVGRSLGYDVQQGSRSGSGFLYKASSTNAITITNAWADRIPGFNVAVYAYGTNDYGNDIPLGTIDDMWISDSEGDQTYAGAINYIISRIYEINPKIILVLATPINRSDVGSASSNYGMGHQNADGHTLKDYCDMMISICEKRGVMCVDRRTSAFNTGSIGELLGDGLHPTAYGYKVLGAEMTAKLGALIHPYTDFD